MAISNPQGNFNWRLTLDGINNDNIQSVTPPTVENAVHKQGSQGIDPDVKTPGKKKVSELVLEMVVEDDGTNPLYDIFQANETMVRSIYAGIGTYSELDANSIPHTTYFLGPCWISKIEPGKGETKEDSSDNLVRTVTFQVQDYRKI